jgi:hypothetical protein
VEALLAARFPRPDVREQIRRLPPRAPSAPADPAALSRADESTAALVAAQIPPILPSSSAVAASAGAASDPLGAAPAPSVAESSSATPAAAYHPIPDARRRARELEPLGPDRFGVHFTADAELREIIERARQLASHRLPKGDLASLMKLMARTFVQHEEKRRFGLGVRRRRSSRNQFETAKTGTQANPHTAPATSMQVSSERGALQTSRQTPPGGARAQRTRYLSADVRRLSSRDVSSLGDRANEPTAVL